MKARYNSKNYEFNVEFKRHGYKTIQMGVDTTECLRYMLVTN